MVLKTLKDFDFNNKSALVRAGFDPPFDKDGNITDDSRIKACLPTIKHLLKNNAKIILMGHNGRPKGEVVDKLKMDKVAEKLQQLLDHPVKKLDDCIGPEVEEAVNNMQPKDIILLENLRFHKEEKEADKEFAKSLSKLGDIFIMDAYTNAHHTDASMVLIQKLLPSCIGLSVEEEITDVKKVIENPQHPFIAMIGGAKPEKIHIVESILEKADKIIITGILANTFLKAQNLNIGQSKFYEEDLKIASKLIKTGKIVLPIDAVVADEFKEDSNSETKEITDIAKGQILDIGPKTIDLYKNELKEAKTVVWGGSIGVQEWPKFRNGTKEIAEFLADLDATTLVCGGDSGEAVFLVGVADKMTHVSIGGGATLTLLVGKPLPAVEAVRQSEL